MVGRGGKNWSLALLLLAATALPAHAQVVRGTVVDATTGALVSDAGVYLLNRDQEVVARTLADSAGAFLIAAPGTGDYYLAGQRLGYQQTVSHLLAIGERTYDLALELTPDPFTLDPLEVTVENEELEEWFTLALGRNPNSVFGFRAIQGREIEEARLKARDNTDFMRWLYIPVSHGRHPSVGWCGPPPLRQTVAESRALSGNLTRSRPPGGDGGGCGTLYVDGYPLPVEHIETIPLQEVAVVVVLPGAVHVFSRDFDWGLRPRIWR